MKSMAVMVALFTSTLMTSRSSELSGSGAIRTGKTACNPAVLSGAIADPQDGPIQYRSGTVVAVTKVSLSVQFKKGNDVLLLNPTPAVMGAGPPTCPDEAITYELSDVRVVDVVDVVYIPRNGRNICYRIMIYRRPGGKIPPLKVELPKKNWPGSSNPWHERVQAYQDWEEKGIWIPDKYLPPGELSVPFPTVAPKPREVKPKDAPAKP